MSAKIPSYSICNLMGADRCMSEFMVTGLLDFTNSHDNVVFPHRHDFFQIVLFTAGSGMHSIDFQPYQVQPGQMYCMSPGQVHTWEFEPGTDGILVNFNESFITAICHNSNFLSDFPMFSNFTSRAACQLEHSVQEKIEQHLQQMLDEYQTYQGEYRNDLLRALLVQLLVKIARNMEKLQPDHRSRHNQTLLRNYLKLIEQHFHTLRLPREYADLMFITPNHLNAVCSAATGKPAGEFIRERVLLEAKRMLIHADYSIAEIGYQLDFQDNAYFSRFFKKYTGSTPEEFRKSGGKMATEPFLLSI